MGSNQIILNAMRIHLWDLSPFCVENDNSLLSFVCYKVESLVSKVNSLTFKPFQALNLILLSFWTDSPKLQFKQPGMMLKMM